MIVILVLRVPITERKLKIVLQHIVLLLLFNYSLFNDVVCTSGHIASNDMNARGADKSLARIGNSYVKIKHVSCL